MTLKSLAAPLPPSTTRQLSSPRFSTTSRLSPATTRTRLTSFMSKEATTVLSRRSVAVFSRSVTALDSTMTTGPCPAVAATPVVSPALRSLDWVSRKVRGSLAPSSQTRTVTAGLAR